NATVNPNGSEVSECRFEYGTTTAYGKSAPCAPSPGSGEGTAEEHTPELQSRSDTIYRLLIAATNAGGTNKAADETFKTALTVSAPTVVTTPPSYPTRRSSDLNATVNPNGSEVSECRFEYGTTTAYGKSAPCAPSPGSGEG